MMDWVNNPKNRPFVLIGFVVILGGAFFLIARHAGMFSGGGSTRGIIQPGGISGTVQDEEARRAEAEAERELFGGTAGTTGGPTAGSSAPSAGSAAPPPGGMAPSATEAAGAPAAQAPVKRYYPPQPTRGDPFTPLPTSRITRVELPKIVIREVKTGGKEEEEETYETVPMRMAGLLWNGSLMAILEENGNSHVVRPGDVIGRSGGGDNIKVLSIKQSSLTVQIGKRVEEVFMKPAPPTAVAGAPPTTGRPGAGMPPIEPPEGGGGGGAFGAQ